MLVGGEPDATTEEATGLPNDKADVTVLPTADPNTGGAIVVLGPPKLDADEENVEVAVAAGVETTNDEPNDIAGAAVEAVADPNTGGVTVDLGTLKAGVDTTNVDCVVAVEGSNFEGASVVLGVLRGDWDTDKVVVALAAVEAAGEDDATASLDLFTARSKASLNCAAISGVLKRMQNFSGCGSPSAKSWASQIQAVSFLGIGVNVIPE